MALLGLLYNIPLLIIALLGIGFVIMFHEFGHFIFAKLFNVHTPSFSIGFGPRIIEKKIGDTVFALSAIPLGGYVEIAGSPEVGQGEQLSAHAKDDRSLSSKPYWQKMLIIFGGILFNIIFTYFALTFLSSIGIPCLGLPCENKPAIIDSVLSNTASEKAGLKPKDKIIAVDHKPVENIESLTKSLKQLLDKDTVLTVERSGTKQDINIHVESKKIAGENLPSLGIIYQYSEPTGLSQILQRGWQATWEMIAKVASDLKGLTKNREGLGGPLMLISQVTHCAGLGFRIFILILAFISINLALFNLLPLPIFDGGQALFFTIEALVGRPLSDETRYKIHYATWIFVILLVAYLTYKDIFRLIGWH